ncbi:MAG: hypothetical protein J7L82_03480, partial [Staphylothermus sp.]|nr:hypothetical protein [Staphylothermus sp.]
MSTVVKEYTSFAELVKSIDEELNTLKQQLAEYLRKLEDVRAKSEQERKLREVLKNLIGEKQVGKGRVVELKDVKLLINPDAEQEASVMEEIISRINRTIQSLQNIRKTLEPFSGIDVETKILVVYREDIP